MNRVSTKVKLAGCVVAAALAIAGCGQGANKVDGGTVTVENTPETTSAAQEKPSEGAIGNPINVAKLPGNEILLTVKEIEFNKECRYGSLSADYGYATPHEGKQLLQIWAEVDARALRDNLNPFGAFVYTPEIVDAEGFTQEAETDTDCNLADDGHQYWGTEVQEGDKEKVYGAFWVPTGIKELRINDIIFKVQG